MIVVDEWLKRIGAYQCSPLFAKHGIDDFFCLPFLRPEVLEKMEIVSPEDKIIMDEVLKLRNMDSAACTCGAGGGLPKWSLHCSGAGCCMVLMIVAGGCV